MQRLKQRGPLTKRQVATKVIEEMEKGKWYHIDDLRVKAKYQTCPRGMTRIQMSNYLREQKSLGLMDHKVSVKGRYVKDYGFAFHRTFYNSWWRRK